VTHTHKKKTHIIVKSSSVTDVDPSTNTLVSNTPTNSSQDSFSNDIFPNILEWDIVTGILLLKNY